eukprot:gene8388-213_t
MKEQTFAYIEVGFEKTLKEERFTFTEQNQNILMTGFNSNFVSMEVTEKGEKLTVYFKKNIVESRSKSIICSRNTFLDMDENMSLTLEYYFQKKLEKFNVTRKSYLYTIDFSTGHQTNTSSGTTRRIKQQELKSRKTIDIEKESSDVTSKFIYDIQSKSFIGSPTTTTIKGQHAFKDLIIPKNNTYFEMNGHLLPYTKFVGIAALNVLAKLSVIGWRYCKNNQSTLLFIELQKDLAFEGVFLTSSITLFETVKIIEKSQYDYWYSQETGFDTFKNTTSDAISIISGYNGFTAFYSISFFAGAPVFWAVVAAGISSVVISLAVKKTVDCTLEHFFGSESNSIEREYLYGLRILNKVGGSKLSYQSSLQECSDAYHDAKLSIEQSKIPKKEKIEKKNICSSALTKISIYLQPPLHTESKETLKFEVSDDEESSIVEIPRKEEWNVIENIALTSNLHLDRKVPPLIRDMFMTKSRYHPHLKISKIERYHNTKFQNAFENSKQKISNFPQSFTFENLGTLIDSNYGTVYLLHGTSLANWRNIQRVGFALGTGGALGKAIYFTDDIAKALSYSKCTICAKSYCNVHGENDDYIVLLCKVNLGDVQQLTNHDRTLVAPKIFKNSVMGVSSTYAKSSKFLFNEYAIYDKNQVYPEYALYVKRKTEMDWKDTLHWAFLESNTWKPFPEVLQEKLEKTILIELTLNLMNFNTILKI